MGQPHPTGRAALRDARATEGFVWDRYVDIFDGGPTVTARTDDIRTVREARPDTVVESWRSRAAEVLAATGRLRDFRACYEGRSRSCAKAGSVIDPEAPAARGSNRRRR